MCIKCILKSNITIDDYVEMVKDIRRYDKAVKERRIPDDRHLRKVVQKSRSFVLQYKQAYN